MTPHQNIQRTFFKQIKKKIPPYLSIVDEVAEVLSISKDSAYRRINGKTALTLEEIGGLRDRFCLSLDELFPGHHSDVVTFTHRDTNRWDFSLKGYLESILKDLENMEQHQERHLTYVAKDLPVFYWFHGEKLAAFKLFFWAKTIFQSPGLAGQTFFVEAVPPVLMDLGKRIFDTYQQISSTEIWSDEVINATMRQIRYYVESGIIQEPDVLAQLIEDTKSVITLLQHQAKLQQKSSFIPPPAVEPPKFDLYWNEMLVSENAILFEMGQENMVSHISPNALDILTSNDSRFCDSTKRRFENLQQKSKPLNGANEIDRAIFFQKMLDEINIWENQLKATPVGKYC